DCQARCGGRCGQAASEGAGGCQPGRAGRPALSSKRHHSSPPRRLDSAQLNVEGGPMQKLVAGLVVVALALLSPIAIAEVTCPVPAGAARHAVIVFIDGGHPELYTPD